MSITEEMLLSASKALPLLGEGRAEAVRAFYRSLIGPDGSFADRAGTGDLYYTVFGLQGSRALGTAVDLPTIRSYLESYGNGERLDMVHLSCLARCWAMLTRASESATPPPGQALLERIETYRSADGGYAQQPSSQSGSTYGCFLALGTCQDVASQLPNPEGVARCLSSLTVGDGSYANDTAMPIGSVPATAAAVMVFKHLGREPDPRAASWLLDQHAQSGGFTAVPLAPEPDLLSTAVALHALVKLGADLTPIRRPCLEFVESLYSQGCFAGHTADRTPDAEYTFYGLMAMGCLAG